MAHFIAPKGCSRSSVYRRVKKSVIHSIETVIANQHVLEINPNAIPIDNSSPTTNENAGVCFSIPADAASNNIHPNANGLNIPVSPPQMISTDSEYSSQRSDVEAKDSDSSKNSDHEELGGSDSNVPWTARLAEWAVHENVSISAVRSLLTMLKPILPELPLDPRTLLKTPTSYKLKNVTGSSGIPGCYYHFGISSGIEDVNYSSSGVIQLQFNVDDLPLFKSSKTELWPILGLIFGCNSSPFVIGIYCGQSKPKNLEEFLCDFVEDLKTLINDGIMLNGVHRHVTVHSFVCDALARSYIKTILLPFHYFIVVLTEKDNNSKQCTMYAIVVWVDEDPRQVSVVPKLWLNDDETKCFWPPPEIAKKLKLTDFQNLSLPALDSNWSRHNVRCLKMEDAVRKNSLTPTATNKEVEQQVKIWLRNAPDRDGGRLQRMKATIEKAGKASRHQRSTSSHELTRWSRRSRSCESIRSQTGSEVSRHSERLRSLSRESLSSQTGSEVSRQSRRLRSRSRESLRSQTGSQVSRQSGRLRSCSRESLRSTTGSQVSRQSGRLHSGESVRSQSSHFQRTRRSVRSPPHKSERSHTGSKLTHKSGHSRSRSRVSTQSYRLCEV